MTLPPVPIFDGHNDALARLLRKGGTALDFLEGSPRGHVDLPRCRQGHMGGGFFAMFARTPGIREEDFLHCHEDGSWEVDPLPPIEAPVALDTTLALFDLLLQIESESGGRVRVVKTFAELEESFHGKALACVAHVEGAAAIGPELENLDRLHELGLRSLGLVWSRPNRFGEGVPFRFPSSPDTGPGLTEAGRALVGRCNELGIVVDGAHLTERGFFDLAETSDAPLVVSHASCHALAPTSRNLTDDQLRRIADSDGVVGINFCVTDLRADGANRADTSLEELVAHFRHVAELVGHRHVAFGSDFDGALIPEAIGGAQGLQKLVRALRDSAFDEEALRDMAYGNWFRVLEATW